MPGHAPRTGGRFDVVVLGGGAAGRAAARDLSAAGARVCLLEARPRLGGRIHTQRPSGWPTAVELGAEFVHGEAEETTAILDAAPIASELVPDDHAWMRRGRCAPLRGLWDRFDAVRRRVPRRGPDLSFAEHLRRARVSPEDARVARRLGEGYHAARVDRMSARALALGDGETESHRQARIAGGYDRIVDWLRAGLDPARVSVRLGSVVATVEWRRGRVIVRGRSVTEAPLPAVQAEAAIVTLPIGVLKASPGEPGAVAFSPDPPAVRRALASLESGHVHKVVLRFREPLWSARPTFRHDLGQPFPTVWTSAPRDLPIAVGWAGGPAADVLAGRTEAQIVASAVGALAAMAGRPPARLAALLDAWAWHDWQRDPFSRGAYAYVMPGGVTAQKALSRPIEDTLYFAGEGTEPDETGTVSGALASGRRAARQWRTSHG